MDRCLRWHLTYPCSRCILLVKLLPFVPRLPTHTQSQYRHGICFLLARVIAWCEIHPSVMLVVQQLSTKLCCGKKHGDQMSVMLCCLLQHKSNEVSRRSAQGPLKKADKSKPMHQSFRLLSAQPTIDKKKRLVQRQGAVSLGAQL